MDATFLCIVLPVCLFLLLKLFITFKKNNLPPSGPPSLPIIGHLHLLKRPLHRALARISERHGPILLLRFGSRPVLVVSSASLAEECFTKNDVAFASRPQFPSSRRITYNYTTLASAPYGDHWRNVRRIATVEVLSTARLNSYAEARADEVRSMVRQLFRESGGKLKKVVLKTRLFGLTLNVMMRMLAGKTYYNELGAFSKEAKEFRELVEEALSLVGVSNFGDFLPVLRFIDFKGHKRRMESVATRIDTFLQGLIDEQRREGGDGESRKKTMVGFLLSMQQKDPEYYADDTIKALIITLLVAGTDTSTETTEWAMSLLLNNPEVLMKARAELDTRVGWERLLEDHDLSNLPYLHSIISETLRICPAAPLLVPHESVQECVLGGYTVPRGTVLIVNAWAIHRDPNIWEEPTKFKPERFHGGRGEGTKLMPFGMGRRKCAGEGLAMRVVGLALGSLIQCFDWERVGQQEVDMTEGVGLTLPKATPLEANYKPRESMTHALSHL